MAEIPDHFYQQVSESIKLVFDLTSRIDERVKILVEQHGESNQRIEKLMERHENLLTRISILENKNGNGLKEDVSEMAKQVRLLEIKMAAIEIHTNQHDNKWKTASDFIFKIILAVLGVILAWQLGVK